MKDLVQRHEDLSLHLRVLVAVSTSHHSSTHALPIHVREDGRRQVAQAPVVLHGRVTQRLPDTARKNAWKEQVKLCEREGERLHREPCSGADSAPDCASRAAGTPDTTACLPASFSESVEPR